MANFHKNRIVLSEGILKVIDAGVLTGLKLTNQKFLGNTIETVAYVPIVDNEYPEDRTIIEFATRNDEDSLSFNLPQHISKPILVLVCQPVTQVGILSPANKREIGQLFGEQPLTEAIDFWRGKGVEWARTEENFAAASTSGLNGLEVPVDMIELHNRRILNDWLDDDANSVERIANDAKKKRSFWGSL